VNQIHNDAADRNALAGSYHQSKFCILLWRVASRIFSHAEVYFSPYWLKVLKLWSCGMWCCAASHQRRSRFKCSS